VDIPEGCPNGYVVFRSLQGLPRLDRPGERGDLKILIHIAVPKKLTDEQKALLKRFYEIEKEKV
jgi:DnaJ-class molecular chaperone